MEMDDETETDRAIDNCRGQDGVIDNSFEDIQDNVLLNLYRYLVLCWGLS